MASTSAVQKIHKTLTQMQKNLECSICLELLQDPVLTKCEHHFCNFCVLALLQSKRRPSAPCPLCKEPITKRGLTTHNTLKGIVTAFQHVVAAIEDDTGQKCTPPRGPLRFSQPEPPSQRPKRQEKVEKKSNVRRGKAKSVPAIPIYLDDEEEDTLGQTSEQCPPLKNNLNIESSFHSPRNAKKKTKKSNSSKGKENTQQSQTEDDQGITGQSSILDVIANESLGQNETKQRTNFTPTGHGDVLESQSANGVALLSRVNTEKSPGKDPYEFIASQRTPRKLKKRKVKEKKKKPWEYSFGKISRKKKKGVGVDSERLAESQSDDDDYDDYDDGSYVHREDIDSEEERGEDETVRDDASERKGGKSGRKGGNADGNKEEQEINEKQIERIDSSDEDQLEETGRDNGEEVETCVTEGVKKMNDISGGERRGRKGLRNAASKARDAIKGQVFSQSSGDGSVSAAGSSCHGDKDADGIDGTEDSYGRSLVDFGKVHKGKDKSPSIVMAKERSGYLKTKQSEIPSPGLQPVNGHISQEFPISQPPKLNRNHGDKLFAKAYGRGKTRSPGDKEVDWPKRLEDDDHLPDVMNLDVDSDEEGRGNSQELFVEDVLELSPPEEAGRTVRGDSANDGDTNLEEGRKDGKDESVNDAVEDVCNGLLEGEVEGQFDDLEEVGASDRTMPKGEDNESGVEAPAENVCPQILNKEISSFKEQRNESETRETLEENIAESGNKKKVVEEQLTEARGVEDGRENDASDDEDEMVLRRGKKRESLKDKMRNKDGLTAGETENIALFNNDPEEHLQSDWELALKLAQEFGSVPPDLDVYHSKRDNSKNDVRSLGKKGRKMRQLQIQNVPDVAERGQHSRRGRSRRNLRSNVAEESDDVTIESFQDDSRGDASGKNQRKTRQAKNERKVKGNVKNSRVDDEEESSSVQCVPETPHVGAKVTRCSLRNEKKTVNERKIESDADVESEEEDGEIKTAKPSRACESRKKVSEVPNKQQKSKGRSKENDGGDMSNVAADEREVDESTKGGKRRSSRLSTSQEKNIKPYSSMGTEHKRKVDSAAGMKKDVEKEMTTKSKIGEDGKEKRRSGRLSKSQEESKSSERKDSRKSNSEGDVKKKAEAEGVVIVLDDGSDEEDVDDDLGQGKRMSARLLSKSQEKVERNVIEGDFSGRGTGRRQSQGRTRKSETASSASKEERREVEQNLPNDDEDAREESGQKGRPLKKKKEDGTVGDKHEQKTFFQSSDKICESLGDNYGSKESCVGTKDPDAAPSQRKCRKGSNVTEETPQMIKTTRVENASSLKPTRATRQTQSSSGGTQALSGSTTESIELDSNPTCAEPDGGVSTEKSPQNKNIGAGKTRKRKTTSEENLLLSGVEKVHDVAKEEETGDRESHSLEGTRKSKRNRGDVKELDKNKKNSFNESKKKFSEPLEQKRLVQEKKREEKGGSLGLVNKESKTDAEVEEDGAKRSTGLGKSKLRSRSSGRKGKVTPGVENLKDGSSSIQDEEEAEEPIRRNTRRQKKDVIVKGQIEDETNISLMDEDNEDEACESIGIDENKRQKTEDVQCEDEQREEEPKPTKEADSGRVGERDEESVAVVKGDPTSPDIFTMHMEASEQDKGGSIGRRNHEEESRKETGVSGEGDGGETPKTSKRKKKKRKTFSFGNDANLVNKSLIGDATDMTVRGEAEKSSKSESTIDAGPLLTEGEPQIKGDDSSLDQFVPATLGASESQGNLSDQIPIPRQLRRQKNEESQESSESRPKLQNEKCEKEDSFSGEVVSVRRISSLKNRGKRQVAKKNEDSEMSGKRFCSDSQFSLNSGEEESMVPPTPPVTASHCQTNGDGGSRNASKEDSLVQAFEKVKRCEEKASGSNQDDKIASSLSSPSISLFQDVEITGEQEVGKESVGEVAEPSIDAGAFDQPETGPRVRGKEVEGKNAPEKENESHASSPEDLPNVLGEDAMPGRSIQKDRVMPEMSKHSDDDLNRDDQEEIEEKDKFVQPYSKHLDEEEPLFDDECPVSPASSIGRHNLTSASSVLSSQSDLMNSQQHDNAKRVLENMEKEIAEMERALAEEDEMDAVSEKKDEVSDEDEEEANEKERREVAKGKQQSTNDVKNASQEAKYGQDKQKDGAKRVLENMEKEIAKMERALAEDEEMEAISEKDEEEADEKERREVKKGKQQRKNYVNNTSQEAKYGQGKVGGPLESVESINFKGVDSISLSSDEDEKVVSKKQSEGHREKRKKMPDRRSSGYGRTALKKYGKYEDLSDIDDKDIAENVKENLSEMAEAEKSLDSLLKAHAARRRENEKEEEEEKEASGSGDEGDVDRPSTPPAPSPSSSPPRSPSPAPLLSQRTLTRRLSPLQKNMQKAEEIVKSFSEERPAASQKRRRVVIEDSDSESEDEVQYRNKRKKSLKMDSPGSYEADEEKVKGQPGGEKVKSPCNIKSPTQKLRKEISPKTAVEKRDIKAVENLPKVGGMHQKSPERKKVTTPQTSSSGSGGSSSKKRPRKGEMMSLVATGLNKHKLKMVDQLCKKAGCKFSSVFIPSTTHVIVNAGENLTCERTLKYFQGISARRWVISFQWVQDSLSASRLLPLEKYEIRGDSVNGQNHCGPRRARLWKGPPLLGDYNLSCLEPFTGLNKDQLEGLLKACGGSVYQHPSKMPQEDGKENFIIAQHDVQEEETDYQALYEKFQVKVISREWVLDSIAVYTTQPITDYLLCDVTECDDAEDLMSDDEF